MTPNTHTDPSLNTSDHKPKRFADQRGIALQTVIIMVVMLAIAGAVAAVIFSRASEVTGELESQDATTATIDSSAECTGHRMGGVPGVWSDPTCTWTSATAKTANVTDVTNGRCRLVGGTFTPRHSVCYSQV